MTIKKTYENFEDFVQAAKKAQVSEIFYSFSQKNEAVQIPRETGTQENPIPILVSGYKIWHIVAMSCEFSKDSIGIYLETTNPQVATNQEEIDICLDGVKKALEGVKEDILKEYPSVSVIQGYIQTDGNQQ